jgi:predicted permease
MDVFLLLLVKLIPLYILILLGYIAGKYLAAQKETISAILMYLIYPVVVFTAVVNAGITPAKLALPVVVCTISCLLCLLFYWLASPIWKDATRNLLAFGAGNANTGYFGIPVALTLFGEDLIGVYILSVIGITFYENTLGFFITAKGRHTARESLLKLAKLPTLYAFLLGVIISIVGFQLPQLYFDTAANFRAAFTILGMMVIGLGLASIKKYTFDFNFVGMAFLAKFVIWPLMMAGVILLDMNLLHLWDDTIHKILLLISFMPLAANMVVFATQLKTHPEKAALAVLMSTLFALIYTPLMVVLFLK